jgi:hypothetical protein
MNPCLAMVINRHNQVKSLNADFNLQGRDDWLWMDDTGKTWTYMNNQGCTKGSLKPLWRGGENAISGKGRQDR